MYESLSFLIFIIRPTYYPTLINKLLIMFNAIVETYIDYTYSVKSEMSLLV